jgi:cupin 2 domain-containing protein
MHEIIPGHYRHYKGNKYAVVGMARHSETQEELVVYRQEYGDHGLWVRPKRMFAETLDVAGRETPRFEYLGPRKENGLAQTNNLFHDIPQSLPHEIVHTLLSAANVRIERIVSHGHASPEDFWYDQDQHEWILVLQGAARLQLAEGMREMKPGDFINIPAHQRHRVEWTTPDEPTIWLAMHYGERQ